MRMIDIAERKNFYGRGMEGIFEEFVSHLVNICLNFDENIWIFPSHTIFHIPVKTLIKK